MTEEIRTGGCLCGAVRYRVTGPMGPVVGCHCTTCRRLSGHHVASTSAPSDRVEITGAVAWYACSDDARRGFCPVCGSNLFFDGPGANLSIHAGTLDLPTGLALAGHIFCAEKGDYYAIADGLKQVPGADPVLTTMVSS